jgi:riboflavin kinase / FMN adenylyltransferase
VSIELIRGLHNIRPHHRNCVVAIGNFDGIHLGHLALLKKTQEIAQQNKLPSGVITFEPHPAEYFLKENVAPRLMRLREKCPAIFAAGIDRVIVLPFNASLANLSAEGFIQQILIDKLHIKHLIVGQDFHFGRKRQGDIDLLARCNAFKTHTVSPVLLDGQRVSSSRIREALAAADQGLVERLLGHSYTISGRVVHGNKRGRIWGFPTANIYLHRAVTPVQGVYAVRMQGIAGMGLPGVANVGVRPTIGGTRTLLEVHLFNFNQDIYKRYVSVEFCKKLRDECRFDSIDLLKEQIFKDAEEAKNYFDIQKEKRDNIK